MELGRIEANLSWAEFVVIRMVRRWAAAEEARAPSLPSLVGLADELGQPAEAGVALHSLFQLAEATLGRHLRVECCCSRDLSSDECAILALIGIETALPQPFSASPVPHCLPGALCWSVRSARLILGITGNSLAKPLANCPFALR